MKSCRYAIAACLVILGLGACSNDKAGGDAAMAVKADNTICPVGGGPVNSSVAPVAVAGKNVGFCCDGCKGKFAKMTDAERSKLASAMK